jgi:integrase
MRARGSIRRQGKRSWRIQWEAERGPDGKRQTRWQTIPGSRQDAQKALTALIAGRDTGSYVDPTSMSVAQYLDSRLADPRGTRGKPLSGKTVERRAEITRTLIVPHLGHVPLQGLKPGHIKAWHRSLLASGGKGGKPLAPATVRLAHGILGGALAEAAATELVVRNVCDLIPAPAGERREVEILNVDTITAMLDALRGHGLEPLAVTALFTGARLGELLALRWPDIDFTKSVLRIERSLEQTQQTGIRAKDPKTRAGRRTIPLPSTAIAQLQAHRVRQMERRLFLGRGRADGDALVFETADGKPPSPKQTSIAWLKFMRRAEGVPRITFHALRHTHASALIASGMDVVRVSRRLGHSSPDVTLRIYAHAFDKLADHGNADAIEAALIGSKDSDGLPGAS